MATTDAAAASSDAATATPLRRWLLHTARLDHTILDRTIETLKAEDVFTVDDLRVRLAGMESAPEEDAGPDRRMELQTAAEAARASEVDARLAMRTVEERSAAVSERAAALEADAESERQGRRVALERRERRARDLLVAEAVVQAITTVREHVGRSVAAAQHRRDELQRAARERSEELSEVREQLRALAIEADGLRDSVHRDELARAEQRMRIEQLETKALEEFGVEADVLIEEYGPDQMVPPSPRAPGDEIPEGEPAPYPYVRSEQEKRLKEAERGLALLGRVNPLPISKPTFQVITSGSPSP